jgi:hypothetical protein
MMKVLFGKCQESRGVVCGTTYRANHGLTAWELEDMYFSKGNAKTNDKLATIECKDWKSTQI